MTEPVDEDLDQRWRAAWKRGVVYIMIDSGSEDHCCPPWFAPHCKLREVDRDLRDVQGGVIETFGTRTLLISMESGDPWDANAVDFLCDFVCGKRTQALFPFVTLMRAGFGF